MRYGLPRDLSGRLRIMRRGLFRTECRTLRNAVAPVWSYQNPLGAGAEVVFNFF